jgi:hypothetical protein
MIAANDPAATTLKTTVGDQRYAAIAFSLVAGCRAHKGATLDDTLVGANVGILDLDMWSPRIDAVAILEEFLFDIDSDGIHRMAFQSL